MVDSKTSPKVAFFCAEAADPAKPSAAAREFPFPPPRAAQGGNLTNDFAISFALKAPKAAGPGSAPKQQPGTREELPAAPLSLARVSSGSRGAVGAGAAAASTSGRRGGEERPRHAASSGATESSAAVPKGAAVKRKRSAMTSDGGDGGSGEDGKAAAAARTAPSGLERADKARAAGMLRATVDGKKKHKKGSSSSPVLPGEVGGRKTDSGGRRIGIAPPQQQQPTSQLREKKERRAAAGHGDKD